jgi:hypothetical protein
MRRLVGRERRSSIIVRARSLVVYGYWLPNHERFEAIVLKVPPADAVIDRSYGRDRWLANETSSHKPPDYDRQCPWMAKEIDSTLMVGI